MTDWKVVEQSQLLENLFEKLRKYPLLKYFFFFFPMCMHPAASSQSMQTLLPSKSTCSNVMVSSKFRKSHLSVGFVLSVYICRCKAVLAFSFIKSDRIMAKRALFQNVLNNFVNFLNCLVFNREKSKSRYIILS